MVAIRVSSFFEGIPFVAENLATLTAVLLVYPPVMLSFKSRERIQYWSLTKENLWPSAKAMLLMCIVIFPLSFLGYHLFQGFLGGSYHSGKMNDWLFYTVIQVFVIAFPEEFFFRGFMQEAIDKVIKPKWKIFGAPFGLGHVLVCFIFAFSHSLILLQWWHGLIFFPALLFTWLKEKTGNIWAGSVFHGLCNLFSYWVAVHY